MQVKGSGIEDHFYYYCQQGSLASRISISQMRRLRSRGQFPVGKAGGGFLGELVPLEQLGRPLTLGLGTDLVLQLPGSLSDLETCPLSHVVS